MPDNSPSNSQAQAFPGMACPLSMSFGRAHGPQAVVGYIQIENVVEVPLGTRLTLQAGAATYHGFVTKVESDLDTTTVRLVDWRDRLMDQHYGAAFNMLETDGRFYHIPEANWRTQRKVYVSREVIQQDFNAVQAFAPFGGFNLLINIMENGLVSAATLMQWFADTWEFKLTAEAKAWGILTQSYTTTLDWNGGVRRAEVIEDLLGRSGCQWTVYGKDQLHITLRGFTDNAFANRFIEGLQSYCTVGANEGSIGKEFNNKGRRLVIVGDQNKYEMVFPCIINWNPAWTFKMVWDGVTLDALLSSLGLFYNSLVGEMPMEYHDDNTWDNHDFKGQGGLPERRTRNEMTIEQYYKTIAWRVYKVDGTLAARKFPVAAEDLTPATFGAAPAEYMLLDTEGILPSGPPYITVPLNILPMGIGWDDHVFRNLKWPVAETLVTDSNGKYTVYATRNSMMRGDINKPFDTQRCFVPLSKDGKLEIEEVLVPGTSSTTYIARVFFNEAQFFRDINSDPDDMSGIYPDIVLVRMALQAGTYVSTHGEAFNGPRVREQKMSVRNLYRAFYLTDGDEQFQQFDANGNAFGLVGAVQEAHVLRNNFQFNLAAGGVVPIARALLANDIAQNIADRTLNRKFANNSGRLVFINKAGTFVDGVIESTVINFDGKIFTETVTLTSEEQDDSWPNNTSVIRISRKELDEEDIAKAINQQRIKAGRQSAAAAANTIIDNDTHMSNIEGMVSASILAGIFGKDGKVQVNMAEEVILEGIHEVGDLLIVGKTKV